MRPLEHSTIKPSHLTYYLFISTLVINGSLSDTLIPGYNGSHAQDLLVLASFVFAFFHLIVRQYYRSFFVTVAVVVLSGIATYLFGGRTSLLFTLLAMVLGRDVELSKLLKMVFWQKLLIFCIVVSLSLMGFLPGAQVLKIGVTASTKGYTLGYTHSNTFAATVGILLLLYAALKRDRLNALHIAIIVLVEAITFLLTRSKTGLFAIGILLLGTLFLSKRTSKYFLKIAGWVLPVILVINGVMIYLSMTVDSPLLTAIDDIFFSGRMFLAGMYLKTYPLTFFGSELKVELIQTVLDYYALDNGYVITLMYYGIVGLVLFLAGLEMTFLYLAKQRQPVLLLIALCLAVWILYEGIALTVSGNFIFLCLGKSLQPGANERRRKLAW